MLGSRQVDEDQKVSMTLLLRCAQSHNSAVNSPIRERKKERVDSAPLEGLLKKKKDSTEAKSPIALKMA